MKVFLFGLLFLGMLAFLTIVYGVLWVVLNQFCSVDYWTLSGCLSTLGIGYLYIKGV